MVCAVPLCLFDIAKAAIGVGELVLHSNGVWYKYEYREHVEKERTVRRDNGMRWYNLTSPGYVTASEKDIFNKATKVMLELGLQQDHQKWKLLPGNCRSRIFHGEFQLMKDVYWTKFEKLRTFTVTNPNGGEAEVHFNFSKEFTEYESFRYYLCPICYTNLPCDKGCATRKGKQKMTTGETSADRATKRAEDFKKLKAKQSGSAPAGSEFSTHAITRHSNLLSVTSNRHEERAEPATRHPPRPPSSY